MKKSLVDYDFPKELKTMSEKELILLSYEIRQFLLETVSKTGGHLASNLGVVELTIALHTAFSSPRDKIIWDVGHQSYVHKILTGRAEEMKTLRTYNGLSGFPKIEESPHDAYDSGHSSTSISAAFGYAVARDLNSEDYAVIAVIGDGALTGGVAYEAMNNVGDSDTPLIVILNDNEMSISENVGGMSQHLARLRASRTYLDFKKKLKSALNTNRYGRTLFRGMEHIRDSVKYAVVPGAIFEELGFKYFGPIDGHNIHDLLEAMELVKVMHEPVLLHVVTKKGKGYRNAEKNPNKFHGIGAFDPETGEPLSKAIGPSYSKVFGNSMVKLATKDPDIVAVCAAMGDATGLCEFSKKFPHRYFDVGIAEQHGVSFAAGMALNGLKPVVAIYSTFLQRAYDEILIDVCMQNLPVVFAIDRAGNVGNDGETHNGNFDLSYLSQMPNMTVLSPKDGPELAQMLEYALSLKSPCAIRYARGEAANFNLPNTYDLKEGIEVLSYGKDGTILAVGRMVSHVIGAQQLLRERGIFVGVVNARFVKPLNQLSILSLAKSTPLLITVEDNTLMGGFGSSIASLLSCVDDCKTYLLQLGWPDAFIPQGKTSELLKEYKLDAAGIAERVAEFFEG